MSSLIERKFTQEKFERRKEAFFENYKWDFMPFAQKDPLPDPELLVPHQTEDVQELIDLVQEGDLVSFVVSEIGMGKTTLCKFLSKALPEQEDKNIVSVFLHGPSIESREQILRLILERLELHAKEGDVAAEFEQLRSWHENYPDFLLVLIVDEFPDVSEDALNIIRSAADLEGIVWILNGRKDELINFVEEKAPALLERRRHIFELEPMNKEEVRELIMFRMAWARGGDYDLRTIEPFTEEAIEKIHEKSEGIPRRALKLAGDAVYNVIEEDKLEIESEHVYAREEMEEGGEVEKSGSFWSFLPFLED